MDQRGFWALLRIRWMIVVAIMLAGALGGGAYALLATPQYQSESELFVAAVGSDNSSDLAQGSTYSQQQARNYSIVATREAVLEPVIDTLHLDLTVGQLSRMISATVPLNTSIVSISVTDTSPSRAAAIANATAGSLSKVVKQLTPVRSDGTSPIRLETVQYASVPAHPSSPNAKLALVLGTVLGLVAGVVIVVLTELVGAKVRTPDQVRQYSGLTIIGQITRDRAAGRPAVVQFDNGSLRGEEFRQLRTNLHFLQTDASHKLFVITSSVPSEGKTTIAVNLAASLAASGRRVGLVDADLRNPSVGRYLDVEDRVGLTSVLAGDVELDDALQSWGPDGLTVLPAGRIPPNPSELLGSDRAVRLFTGLRERFDVVIIDTPPIVPVTDAAILGGLAGGALLVVGCGKVEVRELRKTMAALTSSGSPAIGAIVNYAPQTHKERYRRTYASATEDRRNSDDSMRPLATALQRDDATR